MIDFVISEDKLSAIEIILKQAGIQIKRNVLLSEIRSRKLSEELKKERNKLVVEMLSAIPNEGMSVWEERGYLKFINSFRSDTVMCPICGVSEVKMEVVP